MHEEFLYELISAFVDGEVTEDERLRVQSLLSTRADLRQYHDELLVMRETFQSLPELRLPPGFRDKVWNEISRPSLDSLSTEAKSPATTAVYLPPADSSPVTNSAAESRGHRILWSAAVIAIGSTAALLLLSFQLGWLSRLGDSSTNQGELAQDNGSHGAADLPSVPVGSPEAIDQAVQPGFPGSTTADAPATASVRPTEDRDTSPAPSLAGPSRMLPSRETDPRMAEENLADRGTTADADLVPSTAANARTNSGLPPGTAEGADTSLPGIMLVLDVVLSSRGIAEDTFGVALERAEIPWMNHIPVDVGMEDSLLSSRFFGGVRADQLPLDPTPGTRPEDDEHLRLAFVVARGEQIVETIDQLAMARDMGEVVALRFDIAMGGNESELAAQLHRALRSEKELSTRPVRAHPLSIETSTQQRLLAALRRKNGANGSPVTDPRGNARDDGSPEVPSETDLASTPANWKMLEGPTKFPILFVLRSEERVRLDASRPD